MCELFGFSGRQELDIRAYLKEFYRHCERHPHGWGMFWQTNTAMKQMKEPVRADRSVLLDGIVNGMQPQTVTLAHIRFATVGSIKPQNCHPFSGTDASGRTWHMIHNGTIYSGKWLIKYLERQKGDTDSERMFLYLIDEVNAEIRKVGRTLTDTERFGIIERLAAQLSPRNKVNFMIYDGDLLYVHKNMKNTLHYLQRDEGILFSTEPLDGGDWQSYPLARVCAYRNGERVFEGTEHGHVFVPNLDYISKMAAMNI